MNMNITKSTLTNSAGGGSNHDQWFNLQNDFLKCWLDTTTDHIAIKIEDIERNSLSYTYSAKISLHGTEYKLNHSLINLRSYDGKKGLAEKYLNKTTIRISHENLDDWDYAANSFLEIEARATVLTYQMRTHKNPEKIRDNIEVMLKNYRLIFDSVYDIKKTLYPDIWS